MKVAPACRLFGHCRQAYYQSKADIGSHVKNERLMLDTVREIRGEDPGIGGYKLWIMLTALFGERFMPGRDSFYTLLRRHRLMLPPRKARGTTNSNHRYHKWKNLIKGFVPTSPNQLWVSDITYIPLAGGDICYLHLVTDAYSHKIVGWVLADSLRASATLEALRQAIDQAVEMTGSENLEGLIHHSDRGVQYASKQYTDLLLSQGIRISMTQTGDPIHNALAERMNNTLKNGWLFNEGDMDFRQAEEAVSKSVAMYNNARPHKALGMKTPMEIFSGRGGNPLMEYRYN